MTGERSSSSSSPRWSSSARSESSRERTPCIGAAADRALMGVARIYVILEAEFLAAVQVIVYAGGVMVLSVRHHLVDLESGARDPESIAISKGAVAAGAV